MQHPSRNTRHTGPGVSEQLTNTTCARSHNVPLLLDAVAHDAPQLASRITTDQVGIRRRHNEGQTRVVQRRGAEFLAQETEVVRKNLSHALVLLTNTAVSPLTS